MRIGKPLAVIIGIITLWPIIYIALFVGSIFLAMATGSNHQQAPHFFPYFIVAHLGTMLIMFGLMAFYIVHVFKNPSFKDDRRVLWAIVIFMGGPVGAAVYWWLHIWPRPPADNATL